MGKLIHDGSQYSTESSPYAQLGGTRFNSQTLDLISGKTPGCSPSGRKAVDAAEEDGGSRTPTGRRSPAAAARFRIADRTLDAIDLLNRGPEDAAGAVEAAGEVLDALAATALPAQKADLLAAARPDDAPHALPDQRRHETPLTNP